MVIKFWLKLAQMPPWEGLPCSQRLPGNFGFLGSWSGQPRFPAYT